MSSAPASAPAASPSPARLPLATIAVAAALIALGVTCRMLSDSGSVTVMIPAFLGCVLLILGLLALKPGARRHAMHAVAVVVLLGLGGSVGALPQVPALLTGGEVERPLAVAARSLTALLCTVLLVLCVRSFIAARRARRAQAD
jgi:hypothetical protein